MKWTIGGSGEKVELGEYTQEEVEDCIPLFLEKCVVQGKINLNHDFFVDIHSEAMTFEENIQKNSKWGDISSYATILLPPRLC